MIKTATKVDKKLAVAIAKDVLKHLNKLKLTQGQYVGRALSLERSPTQQAQPYIDDIQKECEVCALGACMLSYVRLKNKVTLDELHYCARQDIVRKLKAAMTKKQMAMIEIAFERWGATRRENEFCYDPCPASPEEQEASYLFGKDIGSNQSRLKAIMENIVKNKGVFKP